MPWSSEFLKRRTSSKSWRSKEPRRSLAHRETFSRTSRRKSINGHRSFGSRVGVWRRRPFEAGSPKVGNTPAPTQDPTYRLARYVVESKATDIPSEVTHEAKRALLNWLGCAIGGCRHAAVETALSALARFSGPPEATLLSRRERLDILHAALMNGISSHVLDFDDTHHPTLIHPSGPVISAALALSEAQRSSGEALLHAIVLGIDVACRIGRSVFPSHYEAGWHITGTAGVFGAAAASGCLLKLTQQQMAWALGIAATQASGLREMFGTMCKSFHPGRAAQNGLTSALLARGGFSSSERSLEAPRGFA